MNLLIAFMGNVCGSGGMEHSCCNLANAMNSLGNKVVIAQGYGEVTTPFFLLDANIKVVSFFDGKGKRHEVGGSVSCWSKIIRELLRPISISTMRQWNEYSRFKILQPGIEKLLNKFHPDVIIAFSPDVAYYFLKADIHIPIITRFSVRPSKILANASKGEKWAVERSAAVQVLLPKASQDVLRYCTQARIVCLPNPVPAFETVDLSKHKKVYKIVNVARLQKSQKRQHLLVYAFSQLASKYPDWNLELWGDEKSYPEYTNVLQRFIDDNGMQNRIFIKGKTHCVPDILKTADLFAFPSAYEGFPNALAEAMSAGLPVVVCNDCAEAKSLVIDGENGVWADGSVDGLRIQLNRLMSNRELCNSLGKNAHKSMEEYAPSKVYNQWNDLIYHVAQKRG